MITMHSKPKCAVAACEWPACETAKTVPIGCGTISARLDNDPVNNPKHYTSHPSGVECIQVTEHFGFNLGNVIKYLWRAEDKGAPLEDLKKARWYLDREIQKREGK